MPLSTDQLILPPMTTTTIPKDRHSDVLAVFRKEFAFVGRKTSSSADIQEIPKKSPHRKSAKSYRTSSNAQSKKVVAAKQTHTETVPARKSGGSAFRQRSRDSTVSPPPPAIVNDTTSAMQQTNTVETALSKALVRVTKHDLPAPQKPNKRNFRELDQKNEGSKTRERQRKSSRIQVKEFQTGSLLQFQPLSKQDKAAIVNRKEKPRFTASKVPRRPCPKPNNGTLKHPSSLPVVSRSVSPEFILTPCSDENDWQTRVQCCGSCVGCTVKVNCGSCQQCMLRSYAPPFQQALLRCMHRICSAPVVAQSDLVSTAKKYRRPDPPVVAKKTVQTKESGSYSPPGLFGENRPEKSRFRLDP